MKRKEMKRNNANTLYFVEQLKDNSECDIHVLCERFHVELNVVHHCKKNNRKFIFSVARITLLITMTTMTTVKRRN